MSYISIEKNVEEGKYIVVLDKQFGKQSGYATNVSIK